MTTVAKHGDSRVVMEGSSFPDAILIAQMAERARIPEEVIADLLREEFETLAEDARITQFIDVLAANRVKARLRKLRHEQ